MQELMLVSALRDPFLSRQALARGAQRGDTVRIARGAYAVPAEWDRLDERSQHLMRVHARHATRPNTVFSHWSAAALHGLPAIGGWPQHVHIRVAPGAGARTSGGVVRRAMPLHDDDITVVDGMLVTTIARTVIDLAASTDLMNAVAVADAALHVNGRRSESPATTSAVLREILQRRLPMRAHRRVRTALELAVTEAGSPLESVSRVGMWLGGFPRPSLQVPHRDRAGFVGEVDLEWPEYGLIGEADGAQKYLEPRFRAGRSVEQVLVAEKRREDRLRALGWRVIRWGWSTAIEPSRLAALLEDAGLPRHRSIRSAADW